MRHNDSLGPTKGGIRYHPNVNLDEIQALAFWMTLLKCALIGLPFWGAKVGITVDPKQLSRMEVERLSRGYVEQVAGFIGPHHDIPAPDVYINPTVMGWMMNEYSKIMRSHTPWVITGKSIQLGGSQERDDVTGRGLIVVLKNWNTIAIASRLIFALLFRVLVMQDNMWLHYCIRIDIALYR